MVPPQFDNPPFIVLAIIPYALIGWMMITMPPLMDHGASAAPQTQRGRYSWVVFGLAANVVPLTYALLTIDLQFLRELEWWWFMHIPILGQLMPVALVATVLAPIPAAIMALHIYRRPVPFARPDYRSMLSSRPTRYYLTADTRHRLANLNGPVDRWEESYHRSRSPLFDR